MISAYIESLEKDGHNIHFGIGSDLVALTSSAEVDRDIIINKCVDMFANIVVLYKTVAFGGIRDSIQTVKSSIEEAHSQIKLTSMPNIVKIKYEKEFLESDIFNGTVYQINHNRLTSSLPRVAEFDLLKDTEFTPLLDRATRKDIDEAYALLCDVMKNETGVFAFGKGSMLNAQIAIAILSGLQGAEIMKGTIGTVDDYTSAISTTKFNIMGVLQMSYKEYMIAIDKKRIFPNYVTDDIVVYPTVDLFYQSGGTVEMLFGTTKIKGRPDIETLVKSKDTLLNHYKDMVKTIESHKLSIAKETYKTAYKKVIPKIYETVSKQTPVTMTEKDLLRNLEVKFLTIQPFDLLNIKDIITDIYCDIMSGYKLRDYIDAIESLRQTLPNLAVSEIVDIVVLDMINKFVVDRIEVT